MTNDWSDKGPKMWQKEIQCSRTSSSGTDDTLAISSRTFWPDCSTSRRICSTWSSWYLLGLLYVSARCESKIDLLADVGGCNFPADVDVFEQQMIKIPHRCLTDKPCVQSIYMTNRHLENPRLKVRRVVWVKLPSLFLFYTIEKVISREKLSKRGSIVRNKMKIEDNKIGEFWNKEKERWRIELKMRGER